MAPSGGRCLCFRQISQWPFWDASPPILRNGIAQVFENPTFGGSSLKTKFKNTFMYSLSSVGYFCPQFGTKSKAKHNSKDFYPVCLHSYPVMHHSIQLSLCCQKKDIIFLILTWENEPSLHPLLLIHTTITTPTPPWLLPEKFPFFFIGPESDHWLCLSVTDSLTHSVAFSWLDGCEWCQLPVNVVTVISSCDKLF